MAHIKAHILTFYYAFGPSRLVVFKTWFYLFVFTAPKLKGRPRKRKMTRMRAEPKSGKAGSLASDSEGGSDSSNDSLSTAAAPPFKNGVEKEVAAALALRNTKEETDFLKSLVTFMEKRNTPIDRQPMMGMKPSKASRIIRQF